MNTAQSEFSDLCGDLIPRCYRKNGKDGRVTVKRREKKIVNGEEEKVRKSGGGGQDGVSLGNVHQEYFSCLLLRW